jgi:DNA (cytosine-5)-methyltransferase 1
MGKPTAYFNEIEPFAAAWLQNLIDAGHIAHGIVDTRSIEDVSPSDLLGFTQCHFFAGIGGWSLALRLAGWPDDRPAWTGSCPCQPFSAAGKGAGFADERHLWPAWQHLIAQCRPAVVFGEQVASKAADPWIDLVHADLEGMGYAFGSIPFPAAGVGAPHIRDRNYWMAYADNERRGGERVLLRIETAGWDSGHILETARGGETDGLGIAPGCGRERIGDQPAHGELVQAGSIFGGLGDAGQYAIAAQTSSANHREPKTDRPSDITCGPSVLSGNRACTVNGFWRNADWIGCTDGKFRPIEPGTQPLAHGVPNRVGRLRAYGNAIVPQVAEAFIRSAIEVMP